MFDRDYLYFYDRVLGEQRSSIDAALVVRLFAIKPGMRILDVPCGEGRIAGRLARHGCDVVGVDQSELFLEIAEQRWPSVSFVRADMRQLAFEGEFDAVVNWFTSFGYFDRTENDEVLVGFARALRPGGRLLLEMLNPARLARLMELTGGESAVVTERGTDLMVDRVSYDSVEGFSHTDRFLIRDGHVRKLHFSLEQVPAPQLVERLHDAGFAEVRLFGRDGTVFEPDGSRLIALAERT